MSDSLINKKYFTTYYFSSNQLADFEELPAPSSDDIVLFQQVINYYHQRLMQHWVDSTDPPERVPENHVNPPDIADLGWSRKLIYSVIYNYKEFLQRKGVFQAFNYEDIRYCIEKHGHEAKMIHATIFFLRTGHGVYRHRLQESTAKLKKQNGLMPFN